MGKASKWLINLLTGKKEKKDRKKYSSFFSEDFVLPTESFSRTPDQKRRWNSGESIESTGNNYQKTRRSFDTIASEKLVPRDFLECWNQQNQGAKYGTEQKVSTTIPVPHNEGRQAQAVVPAPFAVTRQFRALGDAAATKIQAFFRGHLARTALKALKGLVKIQALVRGYLVRKQTSDMLRCMNALMSIQVRARFQRIQMTEEPHTVVRRKLTHREPTRDQLRGGDTEHLNLGETKGPSKRTDNTGRISVSKQEHQFLLHPNQSPLTDTSSRQFEESSYRTLNRISQQNYSVFDHNHIRVPQSPKVEYSDTTSHNSQFVHNYMANTQSSRAKLRSHSEPKQRPLKQKTKRSPSFGGIDSTPDNKKLNQSSNGKKSQQPWLIKIYRAAKSSKDIDFKSNGIGTSSSSYCRTLTAL